jgi:hypothetical protein
MRTVQYFLFIYTILSLVCCKSSNLLLENRTEYGRLRFYIERDSDTGLRVKRVYAEADSSGFKTYFSFYPDRIIKVNEIENLLYTGVDQKNLGSDAYREVSKFDNNVFVKASHILDSLRLVWKKPTDIEAFISEVHYYHGRPKGVKLGPL